MKKFILAITSLFIVFFASTLTVNAACGATVTLGEESLCRATNEYNAIQDGTAYIENRNLTLKNYNGGKITFSSGIGDSVNTITLIGDNTITSEDSYGILHNIDGLLFLGDGTLTIKSKVPFVAADFNRNDNIQYDYSQQTTNTIKITANSNTKVENTEQVEPEDNKTTQEENKETENNNNNLLIIILTIITAISVMGLIIVTILFAKSKK